MPPVPWLSTYQCIGGKREWRASSTSLWFTSRNWKVQQENCSNWLLRSTSTAVRNRVLKHIFLCLRYPRNSRAAKKVRHLHQMPILDCKTSPPILHWNGYHHARPANLPLIARAPNNSLPSRRTSRIRFVCCLHQFDLDVQRALHLRRFGLLCRISSGSNSSTRVS